ncbi:hypothetical protein [Kitasatospora cineracea]|nr:hypothetical protein [Kitasatospora cineracea]
MVPLLLALLPTLPLLGPGFGFGPGFVDAGGGGPPPAGRASG